MRPFDCHLPAAVLSLVLMVFQDHTQDSVTDPNCKLLKPRVRKLRITFRFLEAKSLLPSVLGDLCYQKWALCQMLQGSFIKIDKINGLLV